MFCLQKNLSVCLLNDRRKPFMAPRTHLWKCFCDIFWIILNAGWYNTVAVMGLPQNVRIELLATRRCPKLEYIFKVSIVLFTLFEDNNWKFLPLPKKIFLTLRVCTGQGTCTCKWSLLYLLSACRYLHTLQCRYLHAESNNNP